MSRAQLVTGVDRPLPVTATPRQIRNRKVINLRRHYESRGYHFTNATTWFRWREWMLEGERWLKQGRN